MWRMAIVSHISFCQVICLFTLVFIVQTISFTLSLIFPVFVVYWFDILGLSLAYYSSLILVVGLYVVPSLIGLSLPTMIYYGLQRNVSPYSVLKTIAFKTDIYIFQDKISAAYHLQLALHAQAIILATIAITLTACGIRSSYIFMIPLLFYVGSLTLNLMTTLHDWGYAWTGFLKLSQVIPFLYSSYLCYLFIVVLTPMGGRAGSGYNWDLLIALLTAIGTVLSFGFLVS